MKTTTGTVEANRLPEAALRSSRQRGKKKKSKKRGPRWLHRVEYFAFRSLAFSLCLLPLRVGTMLSSVLVTGMLWMSPRLRARGLSSLEIAYGGEKSLAWRKKVLYRSARHFAAYILEVLHAPRLLKSGRSREAVDISELEDLLRKDGITRERGALLLTSHQGAPEVASLVLSKEGWPNASVVRTMDNPFMWQFMQERSQEFDRAIIPKSGALRQAYRLLRNKGIVNIEVDQDARVAGVFVPYFGTLAYTHRGPATLALLADVPVYMMFCIRNRARRFEYKIHCRGRLEYPRTGEEEKDVLEFTTRMTAEIERMARQFPEQVLWVHRRWKTRPPEETQPKP